MKRYIWIGLLNISLYLSFGDVSAQKLTSFYIDVQGNKKSFFFKEEVSINAYSDILLFLKQEYGEKSEQYMLMIPDTAKFRELYGFPFFYIEAGSHQRIDSIMELHRILPMVAISYEQALAYCQWTEDILNKHSKNKYIWQCSLPEKADYEMLLTSKKAKITQKDFLSLLQLKCKESCRKIKDGTMCIIKCCYEDAVFGLTDNIAEYTQNGMIVEGGENSVLKFVEAKDYENPIGFRIKANIVSKK
jgi:hypothetical protein